MRNLRHPICRKGGGECGVKVGEGRVRVGEGGGGWERVEGWGRVGDGLGKVKSEGG